MTHELDEAVLVLSENRDSIHKLALDFRTYYTNTLDEHSVLGWLLQWHDPPSIDLAFRLLQQIHFIDDSRLASLIQTALGKIPADVWESAVLTTAGRAYDSAGRVAYNLVKNLRLDERAFTQRWRETKELQPTGEADNSPIIMIDDNITSGTQLTQLFSEMTPRYEGEREHFHEPPFSEDQLVRLKKRRFYLAVAVALDDFSHNLNEIRDRLGFNVSVVYGERDGREWLSYGNALWQTPEDAELAKQRISKLSRALFADKNWPEEKLANRLLGYGNVPKFTVFAHNIPKSLPAPFWKFGMTQHGPWMPLFPEREEWRQYGLNIREGIATYQLRKQYTSIDYDRSIFMPLDDVLSNRYRQPNQEELASNNYVFRESTCEKVFAFLDIHHRCLLNAPPGSGKTALAKIIGYRYQKEDPKNVAYMVSARTENNPHKWIKQIKSFDKGNALYIIDDVHSSVESGNQFVEFLGMIKHAKILLISRPVSRIMRGPSTESYIDLLSDRTVDCTPTNEDIGSFVKLKWKVKPGTIPSDEQLKTLKDLAAGDLHLLDYYVNAYSSETNSVDNEALYSDVWSRYLGNNEACFETLLQITVLSQFELSVATEHLPDHKCATELRSNVWVDSHVKSSVEYLTFFHSSAARWFVKAAHHLGKIPGGDINGYTDGLMLEHLVKNPQNFPETVKRWIDSEGIEKARAILATDTAVSSFLEFYLHHNRIKSGNNLYEVSISFFMLSSIEGEKTLASFSPKIEMLLHEYTTEEWSNLFSTISLPHAITICVAFCLCSDDFLGIFKKIFTYDYINQNTDYASYYSLIREIGYSKQKNSDIANFLMQMLLNIDFVKLIEISGRPSFNQFKKIVFLFSGAGVPKNYVTIFARAVDYPSYGLSMNDKSLSAVRPVIQFAKQAGIEPGLNAKFIENCDLAKIGRQNPRTPVNSLRNFMKDAYSSGVPDNVLEALTNEIDWEGIGTDHFNKPSPGAAIFLFAFLLNSRSINGRHVEKFLSGFGWNNLQNAIENYYSAEALSALRVLLFKKVKLSVSDLRDLRIDLRPSRIWRNSFINRPIPSIHEKQLKMISPHLARAEHGLRNIISRDPNHFFRDMTLRQWNIFLRNIYIVNEDLIPEYAGPALSNMPSESLEQIISNSDLYNIGIFINNFSQSIYREHLNLLRDLNFSVDNFNSKFEDERLDSISHFLFGFFYIDRPDKSFEYASKIEGMKNRLITLMQRASVKELDLFIWNYWMSVPVNHDPVILRSKSILDCIRDALAVDESYRGRAGIVGTVHLATGKVMDIGRRDLETLQALVNNLIENISFDAIRILAGMISSGAMDIINVDSEKLHDGISTLGDEYNIENQIFATKAVQAMLREIK